MISLTFIRQQLSHWAGLSQNYLAPVADLAARLHLAKVFFMAGLSKLDSWETTVMLFTDEYRVPLLPPQLAAIGGTAGELIFPVLLALGLAGRFSALGLSAVNVMAVVSYWHVLGTPEQAAGLTQHVLWGLMLAMPLGHGAGRLSLDQLLQWHCHRKAATAQ